jgi:hypothetical protein
MGTVDGKETETRGRTNQRCNRNDDSDSDRQPGYLGEAIGDESIGTHYQDRSGRNSSQPRIPTTGGMLSQLIEMEDDRLAEINADIERLQQQRERSRVRRERYAMMLLELKQRVSENP